jgi:hypothetical protein
LGLGRQSHVGQALACRAARRPDVAAGRSRVGEGPICA